MSKKPSKRGPKGPWRWTDEAIEDLADRLIDWISAKNFIYGKFAQEHGLSRQRLSEFAKKNPKFSDALEIAKQHQENVLFEKGLEGFFNPTMAKLGLTANHDWKERVETDNKHNVEGHLTIKVVKYAEPDNTPQL